MLLNCKLFFEVNLILVKWVLICIGMISEGICLLLMLLSEKFYVEVEEVLKVLGVF